MLSARPGDFVVIKHTLKDVNGNIAGVKFRGGYAVVEKNSKTYKAIKSLPLIKNQPDLPLITLRTLPFITRTIDVKIIFGAAVYSKYLAELHKEIEVEEVIAKEEAAIEHVEKHKLCVFKTVKGELCTMEALVLSPGGYCKRHLLEDPKVGEASGLTIPKRLTSAEKKEWKEKVINRLEKSVSN